MNDEIYHLMKQAERDVENAYLTIRKALAKDSAGDLKEDELLSALRHLNAVDTHLYNNIHKLKTDGIDSKAV